MVTGPGNIGPPGAGSPRILPARSENIPPQDMARLAQMALGGAGKAPNPFGSAQPDPVKKDTNSAGLSSLLNPDFSTTDSAIPFGNVDFLC
jgi:hypothetical protein